MKTDESLAFATIEELSALLVKRKISPVELTELFLCRIERHNPSLNAFLTITAEQALTAARRAEKLLLRGRGRGAKNLPLHGIPVALKDNIWTRGIRSTAGSKILSDFIPAEDSTVGAKTGSGRRDPAGQNQPARIRLRHHRSRTRTTAKRTIPGRRPHFRRFERRFGRSHRRWAVRGFALAPIPAARSACRRAVRDGGTQAHVRSRQRFWQHAARALARSRRTDRAQRCRMRRYCLALIAGRDPLDPTSSSRPVEDFRAALKKPLRKFRLGRPREHYWEKLDPEVRSAAEAAVRDMEKRGATVREVSLPHVKESLNAATEISLAEALHIHQAAGYFPARAADYGDEVRQRIEAGGTVAAVAYLAGFDLKKRLLAEFDEAFRDVDAIVAPSLPVPAPLIGAESVRIEGEEIGTRPAIVGQSRPANLTGLPAISVPCGFTHSGLPIGLQFIGRAFDEATLLRIAFSYESANDWGERHPRLQ